jgi:hypothetical protein
MVFKGIYRLIYYIDKNQEELLVVVILKMVEGPLKPMQNVYYGEANVNGRLYAKKDLSHCVNARFAAEEIGHILKYELKLKCSQEGKNFKIKTEEIK